MADNETGPELSLVGVLNALLRHRHVLVGLPILLAVATVALSVARPRQYQASASFMPQEARSNGARLAVIGEQFGLDLGDPSATDSPAFYQRLLTSRHVLEQVIRSDYAVGAMGTDTVRGLLELYGPEEGPERERMRRAVKELTESMTIVTDAATGLVDVEVPAPSMELAEGIVARLLEIVNEFNVAQRRSQAAAEVEFVRERLGDAERELRMAEDSLELFLSTNVRFSNSPTLTFEHDRLQRKVALAQEVYVSLAQSLEQARIQRVRNTPVITVVERPEGSGRPAARGTVLRAAFALVLGLVLAGGVALAREAGERARTSRTGEYHEFAELKAQVARELRHPVAHALRGLRRRGAAEPSSGGASPPGG